MKVALALIISLISFSVSAGENLVLRGHVPLSTSIKLEWQNKKLKSRVITNAHSERPRPKVVIEKKPYHYLVSVTHP